MYWSLLGKTRPHQEQECVEAHHDHSHHVLVEGEIKEQDVTVDDVISLGESLVHHGREVHSYLAHVELKFELLEAWRLQSQDVTPQSGQLRGTFLLLLLLLLACGCTEEFDSYKLVGQE